MSDWQAEANRRRFAMKYAGVDHLAQPVIVSYDPGRYAEVDEGAG